MLCPLPRKEWSVEEGEGLFGTVGGYFYSPTPEQFARPLSHKNSLLFFSLWNFHNTRGHWPKQLHTVKIIKFAFYSLFERYATKNHYYTHWLFVSKSTYILFRGNYANIQINKSNDFLRVFFIHVCQKYPHALLWKFTYVIIGGIKYLWNIQIAAQYAGLPFIQMWHSSSSYFPVTSCNGLPECPASNPWHLGFAMMSWPARYLVSAM